MSYFTHHQEQRVAELMEKHYTLKQITNIYEINCGAAVLRLKI